MAANPYSVSLPQPAVPFLDQTGGVSRQWVYFLLTLMNRTGGTPGIPAGDLLKQIQALQIEVAMEDVDTPPSGSAFSVEAIMSDEAPAKANAIPLDAAMTDPVQPVTPSPFLYALFVADPS